MLRLAGANGYLHVMGIYFPILQNIEATTTKTGPRVIIRTTTIGFKDWQDHQISTFIDSKNTCQLVSTNAFPLTHSLTPTDVVLKLSQYCVTFHYVKIKKKNANQWSRREVVLDKFSHCFHSDFLPHNWIPSKPFYQVLHLVFILWNLRWWKLFKKLW